MARRKAGFTIIELMVVVAIISVLASILFPILTLVKTKATVTRVHSDLRQTAIALEMYKEDFKQYPPTRTWCTGTPGMQVDDYNELPRELYQMRYLPVAKYYDPFNPGRAYKYTAIGPGFANGVPSFQGMWVPADYPISEQSRNIYYIDPEKSPIRWALWSVGPKGPKDMFAAMASAHPVPKRLWYPYQKDGLIVLLSDGRKSP